MGFFTMLSLIFVVAKLLGFFSWSWLTILLLPLADVAVVIIVAAVWVLLQSLKEE